MIVGVCAGIFGRMVPHVTSHLDVCEESGMCSEIHGHSCEPEGKADGDCCSATSNHEHSPHLHVCCATAPIIAETNGPVTMGLLAEARVNVLVEKSIEPESPVFELDKPPLI